MGQLASNALLIAPHCSRILYIFVLVIFLNTTGFQQKSDKTGDYFQCSLLSVFTAEGQLSHPKFWHALRSGTAASDPKSVTVMQLCIALYVSVTMVTGLQSSPVNLLAAKISDGAIGIACCKIFCSSC